jgi:hypothetical protein
VIPVETEAAAGTRRLAGILTALPGNRLGDLADLQGSPNVKQQLRFTKGGVGFISQLL